MSRKKKGGSTGGKEGSLRSKIKSHRSGLHGNVAQAFDQVFFDATGEKSMKKALINGSNLQSIFVAAKHAAEEAERGHPIVDVPFADDESNQEET